MRAMIVAGFALALAGCVVSAELPQGPPPTAFPEQRGTALPPPAPTGARTAPPEGAGPGGIDFGAWRSADPATYQPSFQAQLRQRYRDRGLAETKADLERNGFTCEEGESGLDCRLETMERQCAFDWYYVEPAGAAEPVAGFDIMCLGAQ